MSEVGSWAGSVSNSGSRHFLLPSFPLFASLPSCASAKVHLSRLCLARSHPCCTASVCASVARPPPSLLPSLFPATIRVKLGGHCAASQPAGKAKEFILIVMFMGCVRADGRRRLARYIKRKVWQSPDVVQMIGRLVSAGQHQ